MALCESEGLRFAHDPSNDDLRFRRNRVRHELIPLMNDLAERDIAPILARTAGLLRDDDDLLDLLAEDLDPTDALALAAAPLPLARRAIRRWLEHGGYPPDAATVARVLDVAAGASSGLRRRCGTAGDASPAASGADRSTGRVADHRADSRLELIPDGVDHGLTIWSTAFIRLPRSRAVSRPWIAAT